MSPYGIAEDDAEVYRRPPRRTRQRRAMIYSTSGERVPPVHKPWKRKGCVWIHGVGWVWNPDHRPVNLGFGG